MTDTNTAVLITLIAELLLSDPVIATTEQYRVVGNAEPNDRGGYSITIKMVPVTEPLIPSDVVLQDTLNEDGGFWAQMCGPFNWQYRYQRQFENGVWSGFSTWNNVVRVGETCTTGSLVVAGPYRWQMIENTSGYITDLVEVK